VRIYAICLTLFTLVAVLTSVRPSIVFASQAGVVFWEFASVTINCTDSRMIVVCGVYSTNGSLVHFPSGVNLNNADLANVTVLWLAFADNASTLTYQFNNTEGSAARAVTDVETPGLSSAFQTAFAWNSTNASNGIANVTYTAPGKQNLTQHAEYLISQCLASGLGGFSPTLLPFSSQPEATIQVLAMKNSGTLNWTWGVGAGYSTNVATGSGDHLIDLLSLLGRNSIAPSPYSSVGGYYESSVDVLVVSNTSESFVSCQPTKTNNVVQRGWYVYPSPTSPVILEASFSFGNDASSVSPLTFTFAGAVTSEFPEVLPTVLLMATVTTALLTKKILRDKSACQHAR
jgi:hypothetical protein